MNTIGKHIYEKLQPRDKNIKGWNSTNPIFSNLIQKIKPKIIVEVGSWLGGSAITMANSIKSNNFDCKIYCIDTWLGAEEFWCGLKDTPERDLKLVNGYPSVYYNFISNVLHTGHQDVIIPIPNTSFIGNRILKHYSIVPDLIYIDGSHEYEDVISDVQIYYDILRSGGIIFGDDFNNTWPGVKKAVVEFCQNKKIKYDVIDNNYWVITKY